MRASYVTASILLGLLGCSTDGNSNGDAGADSSFVRVDAGAVDASGRDGGGGDASHDGGRDATMPVDAGSDAGPYNPCPATGVCYVMPLGDSITEGGGSDGSSYRNRLRAAAEADDRALDFVGTVVAAGGHHEGHSGWVIQQIRDLMPRVLNEATDSGNQRAVPHIVLLMIGTNDTNRNENLTDAPTRLAGLIDAITTGAPNALVVVAQIVPNGDADKDRDAVRPFNAAIPELVRTRAAAGKHVIVVDMHSALNAATDLPDQIHPNDAGFAKMVDVWYAAIGPLLRSR